MRDDEERQDENDYDPRWEVQPDQDDDPGSNMNAALVAVLAMAVLLALFAWLVISAPPVL